MPDEKSTVNPASVAPTVSAAPVGSGVPADSPVVEPVLPTVQTNESMAGGADMRAEVARRIGEAHNVLIALSSDPSVDEMATAMGLSLYLDKLGKRATAIYSGSTPNALEFLKPEETFESSADALQDFVIALNKEKADHLRYKLDGDYVKIYITPYRSRIGEEDLDFSYGDFNVDLVLALDVANGADLDAALREHGRIMHNASIINITTGNPGKLGEIEWSDKSASSVAEMIARLLYTANAKEKIGKEEATAFLTGIVAATNRFANAKTTAETMKLASRLIASGANQQLVSRNITPDVDNEVFSMGEENKDAQEEVTAPVADAADAAELDVVHEDEEGEADGAQEAEAATAEEDTTLLDDLKVAEASLAGAGAEIVPEVVPAPIEIRSDGSASEPAASSEPVALSETEVAQEPEASSEPEPVEPEPVALEPEPAVAPAPTTPEPVAQEPVVPEPVVPVVPEPVAAPAQTEAVVAPVLPEVAPESAAVSGPVAASTSEAIPTPEVASTPEATQASSEAGFINNRPEKSIQPSPEAGDLHALEGGADDGKYGQMLESALGDVNPTVNVVPSVPSSPEINGVPEINYMPMPGDTVLPPPPTPSIETVMPPTDAAMPGVAPMAPIQPAVPVTPPMPEPLGAQPSMQDQVYNPQAADPGAFKIPGM